ncbi:3-keto-5-aminohexanoate cleavage protein [Nocardia heshunensis]
MIEAAVNGPTSKQANPHVPRTIEEIVATTLSCVEAGAGIVHNHNDEPNVGEPSMHSADPHETAWREIWGSASMMSP